MEPITSEVVFKFLQQLGENYSGKMTFYLLGGSALCLLGSPRETLDIDYSTELDAVNLNEFKVVINSVATKLKLDVEPVPLAEFIPFPPESGNRRRFIGNYGNIEVYIFDLYTIALSKIARALILTWKM